MRAQTSLPAVVVAVVVLVAVTVVGLAVADGAATAADRTPLERRAAATVAATLVAADGPATSQEGVLRRTAAANLTVDELAAPARDNEVRVSVGNLTPVDERGAAGGTTVLRAVKLATVERLARTYNLSAVRHVPIPPMVRRVRLRFGANATATTVAADGRVVLHDPAGLGGVGSNVGVNRTGATLTVQRAGDEAASGRLRIAYTRSRSRPTTLVVTVDA